MRHFRKILLAFCVLWGTGLNASTHKQLSDSLQQALAQTVAGFLGKQMER